MGRAWTRAWLFLDFADSQNVITEWFYEKQRLTCTRTVLIVLYFVLQLARLRWGRTPYAALWCTLNGILSSSLSLTEWWNALHKHVEFILPASVGEVVTGVGWVQGSPLCKNVWRRDGQEKDQRPSSRFNKLLLWPSSTVNPSTVKQLHGADVGLTYLSTRIYVEGAVSAALYYD